MTYVGRVVTLQALQAAQAEQTKSKSVVSELELGFTSSHFGMGEHSVYYARVCKDAMFERPVFVSVSDMDIHLGY